MQCRLSTVVLLTIILVLGSYLAFQNLKSQTVTIENYVDYWKVPDRELNGCEDKFRFQDLVLESVSLVRIESNQQSWGYQIFLSACTDGRRGFPEISFLLLMDGSLAIDPDDEHGPKLVKAMQAFDSEKELELVDSMFE